MSGPSGSIILVEENHDLPLVRLQVALRVGGGDDPPEKDGLANFAGELMGRGAAGRTRAEIDAAFDALGTSLDVATDYDGVIFDVTVLRAKVEAALALLADVILRPDFPKDEAAKLKRELAAHLDELRDDDGQLARRFFTRQLYGAHPYGRTVLGTEASIKSFGVAEAKAWHARALGGRNLVFGVAGDVAQAEVAATIARHFGALPAEAAGAPAARPEVPRRRGLRLLIVDKPERTQSQILLGQPGGPRWGEPDFVALQVATTAFGGTFTARLMEEVRSKRGLSYGASARVGQGRGKKGLLAHVFPSLEQTPETLELVLGLWRAWISDGVTAAEVEFARGYLARSFAFSLATPEDRLELQTSVELADVPRDYAATFATRVAAVSLDDTRRALARQSPGDLEIVIVSTADQLEPKLRAAGLLDGVELEILPYDSY
jgi:zinc protease